MHTTFQLPKGDTRQHAHNRKPPRHLANGYNYQQARAYCHLALHQTLLPRHLSVLFTSAFSKGALVANLGLIAYRSPCAIFNQAPPPQIRAARIRTRPDASKNIQQDARPTCPFFFLENPIHTTFVNSGSLPPSFHLALHIKRCFLLFRRNLPKKFPVRTPGRKSFGVLYRVHGLDKQLES